MKVVFWRHLELQQKADYQNQVSGLLSGGSMARTLLPVLGWGRAGFNPWSGN